MPDRTEPQFSLQMRLPTVYYDEFTGIQLRRLRVVTQGTVTLSPKRDAKNHEPILVKTVLETKQYVLAIAILFVSVVGTIVGVVDFMERRTLPSVGLGRVAPYMFLVGALCLLLASWLSFRAAVVWRQSKFDQVSSTSKTLTQHHTMFGIGSKVRVKTHLSPEEKQRGPGWEPQMNHALGRESVVTSIDKHGWIVLEHFPGQFFLKEWLDLL